MRNQYPSPYDRRVRRPGAVVHRKGGYRIGVVIKKPPFAAGFNQWGDPLVWVSWSNRTVTAHYPWNLRFARPRYI